MRVKIIGGGLAGCEAALQLADAGHDVDLFEMRPSVSTPAHKTGHFAELVCSNSFKGLALTSAHGLLKEELARMGSKLLPLAFESRVPAGESLAIDREAFSARVQGAIESQPRIRIFREEARDLDPQNWTLIATGPLTSETLAQRLFSLVGSSRLFFFDSIAPVVMADSLEWDFLFAKNRWDKGEEPDFINCPLDKEQYYAFVEALVQADTVEPKPFEKKQLFEGCLPIEEMARRGPDTLRYGPMRPIGLHDPRTGKAPFALIQLRTENRQKTLYNLVGFQTRLKWGTQKEILTRIPGLRQASFARYGAMHRNTFVDSPKVLDANLRIRGTNIFCAGQLTGAEGYTEALSTGLYAASCLHAALLEEKEKGRNFQWPDATCVGALVRHLLPVGPGWPKKQRKTLQIEACQKARQTFEPMNFLSSLKD